ncbi:hypothetical protein [Arenibaculum pallidiluteum]|uniref:hypothetical protein n=1 Tax=Arenibaculum pallidiluteum TaxID=2812559 RepID=UPI001A957F16|nr:hypothetical protein [Arenibaculum pallidiluteum]
MSLPTLADPALPVAAAALLLCAAACILCLVLRGRLRRARAEMAGLRAELDAAAGREALLRGGFDGLPWPALLCDASGTAIATSTAGGRRGLDRRGRLKDRLGEARALGGPLVVVERAPDGGTVRLSHLPLASGTYLVFEEPLEDTASPAQALAAV